MTISNRAKLSEGARAFMSWIKGGGNVKHLRDNGFGVVADINNYPADELDLPARRDLDLDLSGRQRRAQSIALETAGGYAVAEVFSGLLDVQLKFYAAVRQYATVVTTDTGGPFLYPIVEDFDNEGVEIPDNPGVAMPSLDIEEFGLLKLFSHKIGSKWLIIPVELLQDTPLALMDWLSRIVGERCGRGANRLYTAALIQQAPVAVTTASPTAIARDEIINTYYSVDAAYRDAPTAGWLMNSDMLRYIHELSDATGRPLFRKSKKPGSPDTLLGKPVVPNYVMSDIPTAGTVSALFGDLEKVLIRDVRGVRIRRLIERYADTDQVGVAGFLRTSAGILDAGGAPIQALVQHS
jgi:HK97 family phage major capsid protein